MHPFYFRWAFVGFYCFKFHNLREGHQSQAGPGLCYSVAGYLHKYHSIKHRLGDNLRRCCLNDLIKYYTREASDQKRDDFKASSYIRYSLYLLVMIGLSLIVAGGDGIPSSAAQRHCCLASPMFEGGYSCLGFFSLIAVVSGHP